MKNKRLFSILLSLVIAISAIPFVGNTAFAETPVYDDLSKEEGGNESVYTDYISQEGRLFNFYSKLRNLQDGDSLNIAYFGGSITNGSGATNRDTTSWRGLVGKHITDIVKEMHPDIAVENRVLYPMHSDQYDDEPEEGILIKNINGATGATASYFGIHRAYDDIGLQYAPDVVFLEFTFNDDGAGDSASRTYTDANGKTVVAPAAEYEAIIRQIYKYAPDCEIIAVLTTGSKFLNYITQDKYLILSAERAVLRHYNIPYLYVGRDLVNKLVNDDSTVQNITANGYSSNATWMEYFIDSVHPSDLGHAFYADVIKNYIDDRFDAAKEFEAAGNEITAGSLATTTSYFESSVLKASPHQARMADLYNGNEDLLSGWQEVFPSNNDPMTVSNRKGTMASNFVGASFAFRFTGDSVGFWRTGTKEGGNVTAKVYKIDGDTRTLVVENSQNFGSTSDWLPAAWIVASDLEWATYEVEVSVAASSYGSKARICRVLWNGESNITPVEHPDIKLVEIYPEIELIKDFVGTTYNYNVDISKNDDGSYRLGFTEQKDSSIKSIRLCCTNLTSKMATVGKYRYMFVEYFVPEDSTYPFNSVSMYVRQTDSMPSVSKSVYYSSGALTKGKWETAVIDISPYIEATAEYGTTEKSSWKRIAFCPFGANVDTSTSGLSGATIDVRSIRFSTTSTPNVSEGDDGEKIVYVHKSGLMTLPDTSEHEAHTNFSDAFNALGMAGGTIYFQGDFDVFKDGTKAHGDVKVIGVGNSENERKKNTLYVTAQASHLIKYGNVTLENMSICYERPNGAGEMFMNACGHTLTYGDNVMVITSNDKNIHASSHSTNPVASNFVFSSDVAKYTIIATSAGYGGSATFTGNSDYIFNAGTFTSVYGGSYNTSSATNAAHVGHGDVNYTFNGGTFSNVYTGSVRGGSRYGNVIFTINGGTFSKDIYFGSQSLYNSTVSNPGNTAIIVNCKEISKTATGKLYTSKINIGKIGSYGGNSDTSMVIINNAELADNVNVQIASDSPATYKIQAVNGKVTPVFEESATTSTSTTAGKLLGFRLESDTPGIVPQIDGEKLVPNTQGLYTIPIGNVTVTFPEPKAVYVNATGTATLPDGTTKEAYTTFSAAFNALGAEGGNIYFQGTFNVFKDGTKAHGDVNVIGIGDTDELRAQNKLSIASPYSNYSISHGNITFENLSISTVYDIYLHSSGYTLTFGENVVRSADSTHNINAASSHLYQKVASNFVFSATGAVYNAVATIAGYSGSTTSFAGKSNYIFNAGTFNNVYDAFNTNPAGNYKGHGDVNYTFNGGTFKDVSPNAYRGGSRYGNVIYTINGGDFTKDIFFGHYSTSTATTENPGCSAIIVNCKEISNTAIGKLSTSKRSIGIPKDHGGRSNTSMVILNNAELANDVNVQIASNTPANYKIQAIGGKVTPVFEASSTATTSTTAGRLLGFRMESDTEGLIPCANGKRLVPNADGLYTIDTGAVTVTFVKFTEGDANGNDTVNIADFLRVELYLNQKTENINTVNADLNIDGYIDAEDKTLLRGILLKALSK